ncbi:MAG: efflux RND transporter permease subunit [Gammaproteobacteria bacterium]|nr:MAG: efflux RND transporter permease subunit [Gammaproteobacteria bacterium]
MIAALIRGSLANRGLVLLLAGLLAVAGVLALARLPVDAIPDLSDVQVIVRTSLPGQSPRVVEDQVTYPVATALLAVPGATTVRGYSLFGDSFVYVLFADGTDPWWARSRVLEYLSQAGARLPAGTRPILGPAATGVGWIYQYALTDRSGGLDLAMLRSLQDWYLKPELQAVPGVAEVATVGGMVRQYQVVVDPVRLRGHGLTMAQLRMALERGNSEAGGAVVEMAEAEYMVRATGYLRGLEDLRAIPLRAAGTVAVTLGDVAEIRLGPEMRRGIAELDGEGEVTGGIVVMQDGANARATIRLVRQRLDELRRGLPGGVEIVETYDRSALIGRALANLRGKLLEEMLVVALVCALFLLHFRSSLVIVVSLPLGILAALLMMQLQGISANLMSLGGIAIAIGAMVDAGIVMIENVHRRLESPPPDAKARLRLVTEACVEVGPALFFSLLVVALSFLPVFALGAQEGRLFAPLAWTKTWAMVAAALLSVTLVPVLILLLVRGRIRTEHDNPLSRMAMVAYRPLLTLALGRPWTVVGAALLLGLATLWPATRLGGEFMPELFEGDLMYMPTAPPGISADAARALLQQTDRLIRTVPEVERVFGKAGRAETATDPAPFEMFETTIRLRPRAEWRPGMTPERLREELDRAVQVPGLANTWVPPIRTRIDMLATGVKTPVGIRITGPELGEIERIGRRLEELLRGVGGTLSVYAERAATGRYLDIDIRRADAARYGLNIADVQELVGYAIGGSNVTWTVEGLERYPVNLRYPQDWRSSLELLRSLPIVTPDGAQLTLGDVATVRVADGPSLIRSENARPSGWVFVDIRGRDLGSFVDEAQAQVAAGLELPAGYSLHWSGQYEYWQRALERLRLVVPLTLALIVLLLYLNFRRFGDVALILGSLPFALVGGVWLLYLLGYHLSVAVAVGFIALAGVAAETGVVMLLYLNNAWGQRRAAAAAAGRAPTEAELRAGIVEGALLRLRPKLMTALAILLGLAPLLWGSGAGSEIMRRIAAPMIGGMLSATLLTLVVIPALFLLWQRRVISSSRRTRE